MTDQEKQEFKETTGFSTPEEWLSWEKGYADAQKIMMEYIEKWNGETNSALGALLKKTFDKYAKSEIQKLLTNKDEISQ